MIRELDIYGRVCMEEEETNFVPFLFQGQYNDHETGLAYNRFRTMLLSGECTSPKIRYA